MKYALIGIFSLAISSTAQTTTPTFLQAVSTGIVSFSTNQTAQLNVVNLNPVAGTPGTTATICTVELQFFDSNFSLLKQVVINNVSPGAAASLTLARTEVTGSSTPRVAIRGVVRTNPASSTTIGAGTGTTSIAFAGCPVKTTLEIYNNDTGITQLVMGDVQSIGGYTFPLPFVSLGPQ